MDVRHILLEVSAETGDATRDLLRLSSDVEGFGALRSDARVGLDASAFRAELASATGELATFRAQRADASLGLDTNAFKAQLAAAKAELAGFGRERGTVSAPVTSLTPLRDALAAERAVTPAGGGGGGSTGHKGAGPFDDFEEGGRRAVRSSAQAADAVSGSWIGAALNIRAVMTLAMTALVGAIIAVIPQITLLAASLVGAAVAAGGLATAFVGALGPALLAALPLITGLSKVFAAFKVDQQNKDIRQSIVGRQQLANATLSQARAEQSLQIARRDAARGIRDAIHSDQQATQAVTNAQFNLKQAVRDAYRSWQDAVNGVKDATLALADAQNNVQRAKLTKQQALLDLRNMRKELTATGTELDRFFGKITDVRLSPSKLRALLPEVDTLGLTAQQAIDLKNKILDVSDATNNVKEAEQNRVETEIKLTRAIEERNRFEKQGLQAYRPLVAAQQQLADATWASARASEHLADVRKQGVSKNPQVLAAQDALRSSQQQVAQATNKSLDAWAKVPAALRFLRGPLTDLHKAYVDVRTEVTRPWGPVIGKAVGGATAFLNGFRSRIAALARTQARAASGLLDGLGSTRSQRFFDRMFALSGRLTTVLTRAFGHLLGFFANVADAATRPLDRVSHALDRTFGAWDRGTRRGTSGGKTLSRIFDEGTTALGKWFRLLGAVGKLLVSFFDVTSGQSNGLLDSLTKTVNKWNEWVNSGRGRNEIARFFEKALPAGKKVMDGLGALFEALIAILPTAIHLIGVAFSVLAKWLGVLKSIYDYFHRLYPASISAVGAVLLGLLGPIAVVRKALKVLASGAEGVGKGLFSGSGLEKRAQNFGRKIGDRLRKGIGHLLGKEFESTSGAAGAAAEERAAVTQGGATAAAAMRTALIEGGTQAAAEIRAAMGQGGATAAAEQETAIAAGGRTAAAEEAAGAASGGAIGAGEVAGGGLLARLGLRGGLRGLARGGLAGGTAFIGSKLLGSLIGGNAGRSLSGGAALGGIGAGVGSLFGGPLGAALGFGVGQGIHAVASPGQPAGLSDKDLARLRGRVNAAASSGDPKKVRETAAALRQLADSMRSIGATDQAKNLDAVASKLTAASKGVGRHIAAGIGAGLGDHSGLSTKIENQLRVSFRNLGERATGGLGTLKRAFNDNLRQIGEQIPRHTRSWTRAVSENMRRMVEAIGRNAERGRIKTAEGFRAIESSIRSHMVRGKDAVRDNLRTALAAIDRFRTSGENKLEEVSRVGRLALHRLGLSFKALKGFTDSEVRAMATLAANTKLSAKNIKSIVEDSKTLPDPAVVDPSAFRPRKKRRGKSTGGPVPGYGGGDQWPYDLESGEFVLKKESVRALGSGFVSSLNADPMSALGRHGYASPAIRGVASAVGGGGDTHNTAHINITTAPRPDLPPDPAVLASLLSVHMRARGMRLT